MGTDSGTPFNHHGENALELRYMTEVGMKPADALIAATSTGAALMGLEDRGRIADGMVADLLIVSGNPVTDISSAALKENHRMVIARGKSVTGRDAYPA